MEKLKKEIEEWKKFLIEDLQKILKEEIEKGKNNRNVGCCQQKGVDGGNKKGGNSP